MVERGFSIPADSLSIVFDGGRFELHCLIYASSAGRADVMSQIVADLTELADVQRFNVAHSSRG